MKKGYLSSQFEGFGYKKLTATEVDPETSHGHEFQGIAPFRELFGQVRQELRATFIYLSDKLEDGLLRQDGILTWYDARENQLHRSPEWRLYYPKEVVLVQEEARPGDLIVIAKQPNGSVTVLMAEEGSTYERQLIWLFGITEPDRRRAFEVCRTEGTSSDRELDFAARLILDALDFEVERKDESFLDSLLERFGSVFPTTRVFSGFARDTLKDVSPTDDSDAALVAWMEREEVLFRTLEAHIVEQRLKAGFTDVDAFIVFSLSVQNRRKSRVGKALENHLECILQTLRVRFARGQVTENNSSPDFLFPGFKEYHDPTFAVSRLSMLGVKSTCKDRWRQVLAEANRIENKHLLTLEPGISVNQTEQMRANNLQLVLPAKFHATYTPDQQKWLMSLASFIQLVRSRERV